MKNSSQLTASRSIYIIVSVAVASAIVIFASTMQTQRNVVLNEVSYAQNDSGDWIELYNPSNHNVTLEGFYLSDSLDDLKRYRVSGRFVVPAGGFAVLYGDRDSEEQLGPSLNFNLSGGETLYLSVGEENAVIDSVTLPEDEENSGVFGRYPDGSNTWKSLDHSTLAMPNSKGVL